VTLFCANGRSDSLVLEGRVLSPTQGIDEALRITVTDGVISAIQPTTASKLVIAPAFVDPHVHLRTPGREDEETLRSGTEAAAAGGYCVILAMPNTDPVVDSAAVLGALVERARDEALIPTGFMAAISKGQRGEELTEMAELAGTGAAAFTDDGVPVVSARLMRRALQYSALTDLPLALHCEEPTLSRGGQAHEGAVSAEIGLGGYPAVAESVMVERDLTLAELEERPIHLMHLSARESVAALERALADDVRATAEVTPHHLVLTDDAVRSLDPNVKMNQPHRADHDRVALLDALRRGAISCIATDHAPHARHEKDVPFEDAPFGVTGLETSFAALYTHLVVSGELTLDVLLERMSSGPARAFGIAEPRIEIGARANLVTLDLDVEWKVTEAGFRSLSANSCLIGETLRSRVVQTVADGRVVIAA
jgi:dihydroorotase